MAIVIDASVAIAWCLRDREGTPYSDAVVERTADEVAIVPDLFWHEVRSVLLVAERKSRIEVNTAEDHMETIRSLPLLTDGNQDDGQTTELARRHNLSAYDATYLETAKRRGAELATLDQRLMNAATEEGFFMAND